MAENTGNNNNSAADSISAVVKGAGVSKTGKALLGKAAGPYGTLAVGAWENRRSIFALLCALLFLLMLPVLFILMLPSLIFGNGGLDDVPENVLNDNEVIMENIAETESSIEAILREKHDAVLDQIQAEADALGSDCEYSITDEFADQIIYESALIISQFCASQDDFREVKLATLEGILRRNAGGIFSYTTEITSREEEDEETGETHTIYHYEYIVSYAGDAYFAGNVFLLSEEQAETAAQYASNLHLFLFDTVYSVEINPDLVPGETGNAAVDLALTKLGTPYSQANRDKEGYFDCSSFTYWVYRQLGVTLAFDGSNTAAAQGRYIAENNLAVAYESLAPGDLIFYSFGVNKRYLNIGHVAIYAGNGYVVDASSSKKKVVYRPIYSTGNIVLCGRPYGG